MYPLVVEHVVPLRYFPRGHWKVEQGVHLYTLSGRLLGCGQDAHVPHVSGHRVDAILNVEPPALQCPNANASMPAQVFVGYHRALLASSSAQTLAAVAVTSAR